MLFDHPVGAQVKRFRNNEAPRLGGLEIDNQLDLRGLLDWHAMPSAWLLRNVRRL
jgi:hypothetical protein